MKLICNKIRLQYNDKRQPELIVTTSGNINKEFEELKALTENGKNLSVEIKQHRVKRSLDANALLWKMCNEIAIKIKSTKDEVYLQMLERYGQFTHIIVKKEAVERIKQEWRTVREIGEVTVNGKVGFQIQCYYGSHLLDTKEFSILLDGVISEAKELDIPILSRTEIELIKSEWGKKE